MLPELDSNGVLPPGIFSVSLANVVSHFGLGSSVREHQAELLRLVVNAAQSYPTLKRVLVWGSFVSSVIEPNDLDYSVVAEVSHRLSEVAAEHRRFLVPSDARRQYGADTGYVLLYDYPLERYHDRMEFLCRTRDGQERGIVEINLRGESTL